MRTLAGLTAALMLTGCATMSAEDCATADWSRVGYEDGANGQPMTRLDDREKTCQAHGVPIDFQSYIRGREDGLAVFCRPENGFEVGSRGRNYNGACIDHDERAFLSEYERGRELYSFTSAVSEAESRISSLEYRIKDRRKDIRKIEDWLDKNADDPDLAEETQKQRKKRRKLRDEVADAYDDLDFARDRLFEAERALNAYRISRGYSRE